MDDFKKLAVEAQIAFDKPMPSDLYDSPAHCNSGMAMVQGAGCNASVQDAQSKAINFTNDQMIISNLALAANHGSLNSKRKLATCNLVPDITENDTDRIHLTRTMTSYERLKFHNEIRSCLNKVDALLKETSIPSNGASASTQVKDNSSVQPGPCDDSNNKRSSTSHSIPCNAHITGNDSVISDNVINEKDTGVKEQIQATVKFHSPPKKQCTAYSKRVNACKIRSSEKSMPKETTLEKSSRPKSMAKEMIIPNLALAANHASLNNKRKLATCNLVPGITKNDTDRIHLARTTTRDERLKFHKELRSYLNEVDAFLEETSVPSNGASASTEVKDNSSVQPGPCDDSNNKHSSTSHSVPCNAHITGNASVISDYVINEKDTGVKEQIQVIVNFRSPPKKQRTAYSKRVHACKIQSSGKSSRPKSMPKEMTLENKRTLEFQKDTKVVVIKDNVEKSISLESKWTLEFQKDAKVVAIKDNVEKSITASNEETNFGSLLNYLTIQQVNDHVSSLSNKITSGHSSGAIIDGRCCTLCGLGEREFQLSSCSYCARFIKDGAKCYRQDKYNIFCKGCSKNVDPKLLGTNNVEQEMWIQCEICCCWNHQICALYNNLKNKGKRAIHRCPYCYVKETGSIELGNIGKAHHFEAKDLPRTELSDFIELRLSRKLEEDKRRRQNKSGNDNNEVPVAKDLVLREVSSLNKIVKVDESVHKVLLDDSSPKEFPCKSKVFLLFQKIQGVDVCIFAFYAEEYGSDCPPPNKGCVYLSYIDSVHYLRPCIQDAAGKSYRSFVYHEILLGYMESCKNRNFNALHLWVYPPDKKTIDFIFYSHPKEQKIPDKKHLLNWYQCLIDKAIKEKIVVGKTNLFDKYFDPKERRAKMIISSKMRDVAKRLPYFDGDYWPKLAQKIIHDLRHDARNRSFTEEKWMCDETVKKIYDTIHHKGAKAPLMILQLQHCDAAEEMSNKDDAHNMMENSKVGLSEDINISNPIVDTRTDFLNHCQGYHYQFDSLRNAKHSTMMLLYHLVKKQIREPD